MHTLFELNCTKCNGLLQFDYTTSLETFIFDNNYLHSDMSVIKENAKNSYLIFTCISCSKSTKYTLEELFILTSNLVIADIKRRRQRYVFRELLSSNDIDPDKGLEYCGLCLGADGEGNCYKDVITKCPFKG